MGVKETQCMRKPERLQMRLCKGHVYYATYSFITFARKYTHVYNVYTMYIVYTLYIHTCIIHVHVSVCTVYTCTVYIIIRTHNNICTCTWTGSNLANQGRV